METTYGILDQFRNKAGAWQSQYKADKLKDILKKELTAEDYTKLSIAHSHYKLSEGTTELYDVCKELMNKYQIQKALI